jgi:hypothetical protein
MINADRVLILSDSDIRRDSRDKNPKKLDYFDFNTQSNDLFCSCNLILYVNSKNTIILKNRWGKRGEVK